MKKGFVFSFSVILIFSFLVLFSSFYSQKVQRDETSIFQTFAVEKAGYINDDIVFDMNTLLGTSVKVNRGLVNTNISFSDQLPPKTDKTELGGYVSFINNTYAPQQNASINLNADNLEDGITELNFSNGLSYDFDYSGGQNSVSFYKSGVDTLVTQYTIDLFVKGATYDSVNSSPWTCDGSGSVTVNLHFEDSFGNIVDIICNQDPNTFYEYIFVFNGQTGSLTFNFGDISGNQNAVKIANTIGNQSVLISTNIDAELLSSATELSWFYDATLNYSQGDVSFSKNILLGRS